MEKSLRFAPEKATSGIPVPLRKNTARGPGTENDGLCDNQSEFGI